MVLIVECENCGGRRALFDTAARDACLRCSNGDLKVVVSDPFGGAPIPTDVDERLVVERVKTHFSLATIGPSTCWLQ